MKKSELQKTIIRSARNACEEPKSRERGRKSIAFLAACLALGVTGCSVQAPELTEQNSALVAEYAAGVLLKHNKNYSGKIVDDAAIEKQLAREREFAENTEAFRKLQEVKEEEKAKGEDAEKSSMTMEEFAAFIGVAPASLKYTGYTICDSYPDEGEEGAVFAMTATPGNKLCVLEFALSNNTGAEAEVNVYDKGLRFSATVNGSITHYVQATYALEDLAVYKDTVPAGETRNVILVLEFAEEDVQAVQSLELAAKGEEGKARIALH